MIYTPIQIIDAYRAAINSPEEIIVLSQAWEETKKDYINNKRTEKLQKLFNTACYGTDLAKKIEAIDILVNKRFLK